MKKRILLVDDSLTVQKVVALTLDKNRYQVAYARTRAEAMKQIVDSVPDIVLVSDQVADISVGTFPKEVEAWLGRDNRSAPIVLITAQDIREYRNYAAVLRKPFSPQALQTLVAEQAAEPRPSFKNSGEPPRNNNNERANEREYSAADRNLGGTSGGTQSGGAGEEYEDHRLQKIFNDTFNDEAKLVRETFKNEIDEEEKTLLTNPRPRGGREPAPSMPPALGRGDELWDERPTKRGGAPPQPPSMPLAPPVAPQPPMAGSISPASPSANHDELWCGAQPSAASSSMPMADLMGPEDSMAYKMALESQVENKLQTQDLDEMVQKILTRLMPPIVERLVQERLDKLLQEQEQYLELKP